MVLPQDPSTDPNSLTPQVEMALKIFGLGPEEYWSSHWNKFDAIIVAMSWTTQLVESSSALASFRSLRVIRE